MLSCPDSAKLGSNDNGHVSAGRTYAGPTETGILALARRSVGAITLTYIADRALMISEGRPADRSSSVAVESSPRRSAAERSRGAS